MDYMAGYSLGGARPKGSKNKAKISEAHLEVLRKRLANARAIKANKEKKAVVPHKKRVHVTKKLLNIAEAVQNVPAPVAIAIVEKELKKKARAVRKHRDEALLLINLRARIAKLADHKTGLNAKTTYKVRNSVNTSLNNIGYGDDLEYTSDVDNEFMAGGALMKHKTKVQHKALHKVQNKRGGFDWGSLAETALPLALSFL